MDEIQYELFVEARRQLLMMEYHGLPYEEKLAKSFKEILKLIGGKDKFIRMVRRNNDLFKAAEGIDEIAQVTLVHESELVEARAVLVNDGEIIKIVVTIDDKINDVDGYLFVSWID